MREGSFPPAILTTKNSKMKTIIFTLTIGLLFFPISIYAQTFGGPPSFTPDVLDNPIDGGLSLLLGAGVAYGAKKIRDKRRSKSNEENNQEE